MNTIHRIWLIILCAASFEAIYAQRDSVATRGEELIFAVESQPMFPGGLDSLKSFITIHTKINPERRSEFIAGTVYTRFFVDEKGHLLNPEVLRGLNPYLDSLSINTIKSMPRWVPARQNGKPIGYLFNLPVKFENEKIKKR